MPRVTRAVSRRNNFHDIKDPTNPPHTSPIEASNHISTFGSTRNTLGEITGNYDYTQPSLEQVSIPSEAKRPTDDIAKINPTRRVTTGVHAKRSQSIKDLINPEELGIKVFGNTFLGEVDKDDIQTPPTLTRNNRMMDNMISPDPMSQVIEEQVSPKSQSLRLAPSQTVQTPRFDPAVHKSPVKEGLTNDEDEDSFVQSIISRSPLKLNDKGKWANPAARTMSSMSQSQAGNYQDIEDPLDAIDALEDALEQIGQALPVVEEHGLDSPVRAGTPADGIRASRSNGTNTASKKHNAALQSQRNEDEQRSQSREAKLSQPHQLSTKTRQPSVTTARSTKNSDRSVSKSARSVSTDARFGPIRTSISRKNSHPNLPSNTASTLTSQTSKPRPHSTIINSISRPGFTPSKSTKPPTRSTFELPGEVISRRQKAQREERLKREEEELQRRREFKARTPLNYSTPSFPVKETVASRGRATLNAEEVQNINTLPDSKSSPSLQTTRSSTLMSTRTSSLRTALTGSAVASRTQPDTKAAGKSVLVSPATPARHANPNIKKGGLSSNESPNKNNNNSHGETSPVSFPRALTTTTASSPRTTGSTLLVQRLRGKEIFARDRIHEIERGRERREKEEAAKRARSEAAEWGRMASREWAEKQKLKQKLARKSQADLQRGEMG
ncbi:hypothetical protein EMCG_07547 [[Emmonsia] crescens]|uniref:Uncharacterized protein n=1 Tax=[Emmonsia] crescens TaxID=73230 RepID=A0A0G2J5I6_9EURO|nr:hypothetical protein EMCG_07547 [Emmonsia crescens UAMH 3008]